MLYATTVKRSGKYIGGWVCVSTGPTREVEISLRFSFYIQVGYEVSYHGMRNKKLYCIVGIVLLVCYWSGGLRPTEKGARKKHDQNAEFHR